MIALMMAVLPLIGILAAGYDPVQKNWPTGPTPFLK
jgi:hypothetical protein